VGYLDYFIAEDAYVALAKIHGGLAVGSVTGTTYWVDSTDANASDVSGKGTFSSPWATIAYALTKATGSGAVILVKPNHRETIDSTADWVFAANGVSVIGLGFGYFRPQITISGTGAHIIVGAINGVRLENLRFLGATDDLDRFIYVYHAATATYGFTLLGCEFRMDAAASEPDDVIVFAVAGSDHWIEGNRFCFTEQTNQSETCIKSSVAIPRTRIINNYIGGNFLTSCISLTAASADLVIKDNLLVNTQLLAVAGLIDLHASCTGAVVNNRGFHGYDIDLTACIDPGACANCENYANNVVTEAGGIVSETASPNQRST
jgi:hypothetical protein